MLSSWYTVAMPWANASRGLRNRTSRPSRTIRPPVGSAAPANIFTNVLLPAPFLPISALTLPPSKRNDTPSRATVPG